MVAAIAIGSISFVYAIVYSIMNLAFHYPKKSDDVKTKRVLKWGCCIKVLFVLATIG